MPRVEREASPSPPPGYRKRQAEDSSVGLALRRLHDRSATIAAATRIKNRRWQHGLVKMWMVAMRKVLVAIESVADDGSVADDERVADDRNIVDNESVNDDGDTADNG